jgi:hypothetical protein
VTIRPIVFCVRSICNVAEQAHKCPMNALSVLDDSNHHYPVLCEVGKWYDTYAGMLFFAVHRAAVQNSVVKPVKVES